MEQNTHIVAGEVTTLEHEARNDTVEGRALVGQDVAIVVVALAELSEVAGRLRNILIELEFDAALLG